MIYLKICIWNEYSFFDETFKLKPIGLMLSQSEVALDI